LQAVYSQLQSEQLRGTITFEQACRELHHRVESMKADDLIDGRSGRALISTEHKKHGQGAIVVEKVSCLAKDCAELVQPYLPLCKLCYLQSMAGKVSVLALRDNLGNAVFNSTTKRLDFPSGVPKSRFPQKGLKKGRKVLLAGLSSPLVELSPVSPSFWSNHDQAIAESSVLTEVTAQDCETIFGASTNHGFGIRDGPVLIEGVENDSVDLARVEIEPLDGGTRPLLKLRCLLSAGISRVLLYLDSGAGQSLSSCITAFVTMIPCQVEITGIAGALQIYGCGTALFSPRRCFRPAHHSSCAQLSLRARGVKPSQCVADMPEERQLGRFCVGVSRIGPTN
jgi:hypothetical protein